eukprot:2157701-Pleurochrysis_carterae.AAC.1
MDLTSAKRHSVEDASQRALTNRSESEKLGTTRTSRSVTGTVTPLSSRAESGSLARFSTAVCNVF